MSKVRYVGDENVSDAQVAWGYNDDPRGVLNTDTEYEVVEADVRSWHVKLELREHPGLRFNSVHFERVES